MLANTHLPDGIPTRPQEVDHRISGYADQREGGEHPAYSIGPVRIGIASIVVGGLMVVDQTEHPYGLQMIGNHLKFYFEHLSRFRKYHIEHIL